MDLEPADGALLLDRFDKLLDLSGLLLQQAVTVHADAFRRYSGMAAGARRVVAIEAGDLVIAGVNLVGKRDRLNGRIAPVNADAGQFPSHKARPTGEGQNDSGDYHRSHGTGAVSYTHLRAHETRHDLVCRLLLEK